MNKFLATLFLAAAATAEADPYLLGYGAGYAGLGYAGYGGLGYAGHAGYAGYGGLGYAGYAAPYAAGYASVSPSASVNIAGLAPAAIPAVGGAYAGAGRYVANSAGVVHVAKREAEADADAFYGAYGHGYAGLGYAGLGYAGLGYAGLGYAGLGHAGLGYAGHGYAAPVAAVAPVAAGYASVSPSASVNIAGLAPAAIPAIGGAYAGAGRYVANSAGVVHVAKREAEADAFYGAYGAGLGYAGLGYAGLGYAGLGYAGLGYAGLGYAGLGHAGLGYAGLGHGYAGLGYAAPAVAAVAPVAAIAPVAASYAQVSPSASLTTLGAAPAAIPAVGGAYAGAGRYVANSAGVIHAA